MKKLLPLLAVLAGLGFSCAVAQEDKSQMRTWTSSVGTKIEAELVSTTGKQVTLKTKAGRTLKVALNKLSESDRNFLKGNPSAAKPAEGDIYPRNMRLHPRSKMEIKVAMVEMRKHADEQSAFTKEERDACYYLNVYRYLAGLYHETKLDRSLCDAAVKAATGCEELGKLDHGVNPEAGKCNLGHGSISDSIHSYMNDGGASNREHRAHRAWCLSPKLGKLGIGAGKNERFCAMWTMDRSANSRIRGDFFAYPCPGYFPVSCLNENTAWTVYFPGARIPAKGEIEVEVYKVSKAPEKLLRHGDVPEGGRAVQIKHVSLSEWVTPCVNFEPSVAVKSGKKYWVSIKGGAFKAAYLVEFLSL